MCLWVLTVAAVRLWQFDVCDHHWRQFVFLLYLCVVSLMSSAALRQTRLWSPSKAFSAHSCNSARRKRTSHVCFRRSSLCRTVKCLLPASYGLLVPVVITVAGQASTPVSLLSYSSVLVKPDNHSCLCVQRRASQTELLFALDFRLYLVVKER